MAKLRWRLFFASIPSAAHLIAFGAMVVWLAKIFWLDGVPEVFWFAHELGGIGEELLAAILAGYVGFLAFVLFPQFREEQSIAPYLQVHTARVVGNCFAVLDEINRAAGTSLALSSATNEAVRDAFMKVPFKSHPNMLDNRGQPVAWLEFFRYRRERTRGELSRLERQARFFGSDLALLLTRIDENTFFMMCEAMEGIPANNTTLEVLGPSFYKYCIQCLALMEFHDMEFVPPAVALKDYY